MSTIDTAIAAVQEPESRPLFKSRSLNALNEMVETLAAQQSLETWNCFVRTLDIPANLAVAIQSNRPEMVALAQPSAMSAAEVAVLYKMIGTLLETNQALRTHAAHTARLVDNWHSAFTHLASVGHQITSFANFRRTDQDPDEA